MQNHDCVLYMYCILNFMSSYCLVHVTIQRKMFEGARKKKNRIFFYKKKLMKVKNVNFLIF